MTARRVFLLGTVALAMTAILSGPAAAQNTIKIGELNSYKNFPAFLEPYNKGWELALAEVNNSGGVLGKKIEVSSRDVQARMRGEGELAHGAGDAAFDARVLGLRAHRDPPRAPVLNRGTHVHGHGLRHAAAREIGSAIQDCGVVGAR